MLTRAAQLYNAVLSPLCLCDFCPRAFHLSCLDLVPGSAEQMHLREGDWACPKCVCRQPMRSGGEGAVL